MVQLTLISLGVTLNETPLILYNSRFTRCAIIAPEDSCACSAPYSFFAPTSVQLGISAN